MFETIDRTSRSTFLKRFSAFMISVFGHAAAILLLVIVPLVFFNALTVDVITYLVAPPPLPESPPPPPPRPEGMFKQTSGHSGGFIGPIKIPEGITPPAPDDVDLVPASGWEGSGFGADLAMSGVTGNGIASSALALASVAPPSPVPPPPPPVVGPPRAVVSKLQESKLIKRVEPVYPELARRTGVSGVVILKVIVDEEGNVATVTVLQGHPLLNDEAVRAVAQWKYSPTVLNGEPVQVMATVTVIFNLNRR